MAQLLVKPSSIHGIGLFTNEFIAKGSRIAGMRVALAGKREAFTTLPVTGLVVGEDVYAVVEGFPLWYVNYSDSPNIEIVDFNAYAIKSMAKGDELTIATPTY